MSWWESTFSLTRTANRLIAMAISPRIIVIHLNIFHSATRRSNAIFHTSISTNWHANALTSTNASYYAQKDKTYTPKLYALVLTNQRSMLSIQAALVQKISRIHIKMALQLLLKDLRSGGSAQARIITLRASAMGSICGTNLLAVAFNSTNV